MSEMLDWLRLTIEGDKAAAEAADRASPGPWVNTGQDGLDDAWQIHGASTGDMTWKYDRNTETEHEVPVLRRVATLNYDDGGGVWEREAADHIVLQQPRDTIARCTAELMLLDDFIPIVEGLDYIAYSEGLGSLAYGEPQKLLIKTLALGYQHRPGFNPAWLEDPPVEPPFDWARTEAEIAEGRIADPAWIEVSRASAAVRAALGLAVSMREARDIPHPFVAAEGEPYASVREGYLAQYCAACGCIQSLIAHRESWVSG